MQAIHNAIDGLRSNNVRTRSNRARGLSSYIKNLRNIRIAGTFASFGFVVIMILAAFPIVHHLELAEAATGTASTTTLTIDSEHPSASLDLSVYGQDGTFAQSTTQEQAAFSVATNNVSGYTLSISGSDDAGKLNNNVASAYLSSIDAPISETTFDNSIYNGKWGYKPSMYNSETNTSFRPAPTTSSSELNKTNCANGAPTTLCPDNQAEDSYTISLGTRADYLIPAGTYTNTYTLTAVGNPVAYTVNYADNSGDNTVTGSPISPATTTSGNTTDTTITLTTDTPTRTNYAFKSWCLGTVSDEGTTCTGTEYNAGGSFGIDQTTENITTLYAVWKLNTFNLTINFAGEGVDSVKVCKTTGDCSGDNLMGTVSTSGNAVSNLAYGTAYYLYPTFTSNHEFVSWAKTSGEGTLSSTTIANPTYTIGNGNGTVTVTGKLSCTPISGTMQAFALTPSACPSGTLTDSRDSATYTVAKINGNWWMTQNLRFTGTSINSSTTNINTTKTLSYGDLTSGDSYTEPKIHNSGNATTGVWYNYCAASAGTICTESNYTEASYSLCPAGWRLPTNSEQSTITSYSSAYSPVAGGGYNGGSLNNTSFGRWWSSTASNDSRRHSLYWDGSRLDTGYYLRNSGFYVRCVLDTRTPYEKLQAGVLSMQDIGNLSSSDKTTLLSQMGTNYYTVPDNRDGQSYVIQKLADGKCWMMTNLNLNTSNTDLTSSNTNLSTTVSKATFNGWKKTSGSGTYTSADLIPVSGTDSTSGTAYGTLYNYCAASAGTICTSSNSSNASYDICPKGWRLPTGGSSGEFKTLYNQSAYNSNANMRKSYTQGGAAFALAGDFNKSTPTDQGSSARYWSSTRYNNTSMYVLLLNTSDVGPADSYYRNRGRSIRCVLDTRTIADATNLQDVTSDMAARTAVGATATLKDSRDNQTYTVAKLPDGKVWMTRNLAIGCAGSGSSYSSSRKDASLSSSNSNVSSYTINTTNVGDLTADTSGSYTQAYMQCDATYGAWYNYMAATAGTISGSSNSTEATSDICPSGWRLPTHAEQQAITSYTTAFSPVTGGLYRTGSLGTTGSGYWWSSTAYVGSGRHVLYYNGSSLDIGYYERRRGLYVRCVRAS